VKSFQEFYEELEAATSVEGLDEYNLEKDKDTISKMSEDEKRWSFFSNAFVYRKVRNTPDILYSKLVQLMERQDKKTISENVSYTMVSPSTELVIQDMEEKESEETKLEDIASQAIDSMSNKIASKVIVKVADKINQSVRKPLPSQQISENDDDFVPTPVNDKTIQRDNNNNNNNGNMRGGNEMKNIKIEYMDNEGESMREEEIQDSESVDEYESESESDGDM
jgi:hypothetical protein